MEKAACVILTNNYNYNKSLYSNETVQYNCILCLQTSSAKNKNLANTQIYQTLQLIELIKFYRISPKLINTKKQVQEKEALLEQARAQLEEARQKQEQVTTEVQKCQQEAKQKEQLAAQKAAQAEETSKNAQLRCRELEEKLETIAFGMAQQAE